MKNLKFLGKSLVAATDFTRNNAKKIFDDAKEHGPKIVLSNNTPISVIISTEDYVELLDELDELDKLREKYQEEVDESSTKKRDSKKLVDASLSIDELKALLNK